MKKLLALSSAIALVCMATSALIESSWLSSPLLDSITNRVLDLKFRLRGPVAAQSRIIIVAGDEKAFQKFGVRPWDRATVFAPFLEHLCKFDVKAVGIDFLWTDPERPIAPKVRELLASELGPKASLLDQAVDRGNGDLFLRKAIESCGRKVVLGYTLQNEDVGIPREVYENGLKLLLDPAAHNAMKATTTAPFHYTATTGLIDRPDLVPPGQPQGFGNFQQDSDGIYRRQQLVYRAGDSFVPALALRMAQLTASPGDAPIRFTADGRSATVELPGDGGYRALPVDKFSRVSVNYRGPSYTYPWVSLADVVNDDPEILFEIAQGGYRTFVRRSRKADFFRNAYVLYAYTAQGASDFRPNPFAALSMGVENHANVLDNILRGDFLEHPFGRSPVLYFLCGLAISVAFGLGVIALDGLPAAALAVAAIAGLLAFDQLYLFSSKRIVFFSLLPALQLALQYVAVTTFKFIRERSEKKNIRAAFDKYVSPDVINQILAHPDRLKLGGEKKQLSVLFSDIRGFTDISERLKVETLTELLNEYLGAMTEVLQRNSGTLDKYIGDAVMGFWGAPLDVSSHATLAVKTAIEMIETLDRLNPGFFERYGWELQIGIGINSGDVLVGNFGSNRVFEYTVIGDNVNLASRLEGLNKYYGCQIVISEVTHSLLEPGLFRTREIDRVRVKGKKKAVGIYEVFPDSAKTERLRNALETFARGLAHYYAREFGQAAAVFKEMLEKVPGDGPSVELLNRCAHFEKEPPEADWDGSWKLDTK